MSKKRNVKKQTKQNQKKTARKQSKRNAVIAICAAVVMIATIATAVIISSLMPESIANTTWIPDFATNTSDEAVELAEVYNTRYDNYSGVMRFNDDSTFELWMAPGSGEDGTHTGIYEFSDDNTIKALFDEGTATEFKIERDGAKIKSIMIHYEDYKVYFVKKGMGE